MFNQNNPLRLFMGTFIILLLLAFSGQAFASQQGVSNSPVSVAQESSPLPPQPPLPPALPGQPLVNMTMAQSDASHTSDQPTSPIINQINPSEAQTVKLTTEFAATGGVAGFVTAPSGRPLPRIQVMIYQQQPWGWEVVQSAVTEPSGHYLIPSLERGIYRLHFLDPAGAYAPEFYDHAMSVDEATDILVSGELIPDINMVLFPKNSRPTLETPSYQMESVSLPSSSSGISGTITTSGGTPLAGIEVSAYQQQPSGSWNKVRTVNTNASGTYLFALETAIYRLRFRDPSGSYAFEYYDNALTLDQATNIPVIGDTVPNINAVLSPAGHITGTLSMFDGERPNYACLVLYYHNGFGWEQLSDTWLWSYPTSYDVGGLANGDYRLEIYGDYRSDWYHEHYNNASSLDNATDISVTAGSTTADRNVILGDGGGRIAGTVTSPAGTPLSGIEVTAYISQTTSWSRVGSITTNISGTYQLPELDNGDYTLRFGDPAGTYAFEYYDDALNLNDATPIHVSVGSVSTGINAVLSPAGHITGTLSMFDGERPDTAYLYLYYHNGFGWEQLSYAWSGWYPTSYDVGGLASGDYRLDIQGYYRGDLYDEFYNNASSLDNATDISVTAGSTADRNVILGDGGGRIAGTVTSPAGTPLSGIEVTAYISQTTSWSRVGSITTNISGTYQLPELDNGDYTLRFRDPAGTYAFEYYDDALKLNDATPIHVTVGSVSTGINAVLSPAGHITGTLNMFDGERPDYAYLYLYYHNGFGWEQLSNTWSNWYPTSYDMGGLASGNYRLYIQGYYRGDWYDEHYNNASSLNNATDISVTAGSTTADRNVILGDVIYNGRITGTVTANGVPQEGILIDLYQDYTGGGNWWRLVYAHTDANGNYSIGALKDGLYRVRFSDEQGAYATVYYDGVADLPSANTVTITNQTTVPNINASLTGAGSITGTVTLSGGGAGEGISVVAYRHNGNTWEVLGTAISDQNGEYSIGRLLPGNYRLYFQDTTLTYRTEYYNDARSITNANDVAVTIDTVTPNINVVLDLPSPPLADVSMFGNSGSVVSDPWTGEVTITFRRSTQLNTTIRTNVSCNDGSTPTNVTLWMNSSSYAMTATSPSGTYIATIPANDIINNATLTVRWQCNGTSQQQTIGEIVLYDPSGYITDSATGLPVEGATVTLYRVPNWLPDTGGDMLNCRTVDSRSGSDWSSEPDASIDLGVLVNPEIGQINGTSEISPTINPQITDPAGYYGWDVTQGCWYVAVQAEGYETRVSPVVGVPPEVTDLDLALTPYPPMADFTVSTRSGQAPLTVVFSDTSSGTVTERLWDFGDGGSSEQVTLTHTYTEAGIYTVGLRVSNPSGSDAITRTNFIAVTNTPLVPDIDVNPISLSTTVGTEQTTEQTLTISNDGTGDLEWTIFEETTALRLPDKPLMQEDALPAALDAQPSGNSRFAGSSQAVEKFGQMARPMAADDQRLTHSASQEITDLNSIACQNGDDLHRDNSYYRLFDLSGDFAIDDDFEVTSIEFGVQLANGADGEQPVTVNLYTLDGSFVLANLTPIGSAEVNLPDQSLTIASVPVSGTVPAGSTLVVEIFTPSGVAEGNTFFIGSNNQGQTAPSYIRAPYCNVSQPTNVADIGAPQMQIVMNVSGHVSESTESTCPTGDIAWASLSPSAGTTAAGDSDEVTVTFDSTGLAVGTYNGQLCIESNDPDEPSVVVPLTLDVDTESIIAIYTLAFDGNPTASENLSPLFQPTMDGIVAASIGAPNKRAVVLVDQDGEADTRIFVVHNGVVTPTVGLPDALGQLNQGLNEYDMADGETLGGFLRWALQTYTAPETKTILSIVTHGAPLVPAVDFTTFENLTTSQQANRAANGFYFPLGDIHVKSALTDDYPQRSLLTPHALQVALDMATDGGNNPLEVMDIVHCFSGSVEEFYELSNPEGTPYAEVIGGAANYSYFAPEMLGRAFTNLDPYTDAASLGTSIMSAYEQVLQEADDEDGNPATTEHPRTMVLVDSSQLVAIKEKIDQMAWDLMQAFESNPIGSKDKLTAAYHATGTYYDLNYCPPRDWELAPPDGLVDVGAFLQKIADQNISPEVTSHALEAVAEVNLAVIHQSAKSGTPWFAEPLTPTWTLTNTNASGLALYADLEGTANGGYQELSWHATFYTDTTELTFPNRPPIENNHPYLFVQGGYNGATWADVFSKYWQVKSEDEALTLRTIGCLPVFPPILREGELSVEQIILPANIYVGSPTSFVAEIHTEATAINPLIGLTVHDASASIVFSDTVAAGYLVTGTHSISITNVWTPTMAGEFTLEVMVDPDDYFIEQNEQNNVAVASGEVLDGEATGVMLALEPPTVTTGINQTFELPIVVHAGTQEVDGVSAHLNFDPAYLEVVSITPGSDFSTVILNQFDNNSGQLDFAAGSFNNFPSGTFTLATVTFNTIALTDEDGTTVEFNSTSPRISDVTSLGTSVLDHTEESTIFIENAALEGAVTLQGRPNPPHSRWSVPLRVSLTVPGESTPAYSFEPTTDENGHFTLSGILPGTYDVRVKNSQTLQNKETVTLVGGDNGTIDFGTLREGDANDDNYVTLVDFSILVTTFAKCQGMTGYDARADFNSDSCVTILDFSLLASNFAQGGDRRPEGGAQQAPTGNASLLIEPSAKEVAVGESFTMTVFVEGSQAIDGTQVKLNFDATQLEVERITAGDKLPLELLNQFDNSSGTINFAAGSLEAFPSGTIEVVEVQFKALEAGESTLAFQTEQPFGSSVTFAGAEVLNDYTDGMITISNNPTAISLHRLDATTHIPFRQLYLLLALVVVGLAVKRIKG